MKVNGAKAFMGGMGGGDGGRSVGEQRGPPPASDLEALMADGETYAKLMMLTSGSVAAYLNFEAFKTVMGANHASALTLTAGLVASVAIAFALVVVWHFALTLAPRLMQGWSRSLAVLGILIPTIVFTLGISAYPNGVALIGGAAMEYDLRVKAEAAQEAVSRTTEDARALGSLCAAVAAKAAPYGDDAAAEEKTGALSGSAGKGPVTGAFRRAAAELGALGESCTATMERIDARASEAKAHSDRLREIAQDRRIPALERAAAFGREAGAIELKLGEMRQQGALIETIRQVASVLKDSAPQAGEGGLLPGQARALAGARQRLTSDGIMLVEFADKLSASMGRASARFEPLTPTVAVIRYAQEFLLWWVAACMLDLAPVAVLAWLVLGHRGRLKEKMA